MSFFIFYCRVIMISGFCIYSFLMSVNLNREDDISLRVFGTFHLNFVCEEM